MQFFDNSSLIFPITQPLPRILGEPRLKTEVIRQIQSDAATNAAFLTLPRQAQEAFLDFCMGNRGLKVTYDPFFLHIFDPALLFSINILTNTYTVHSLALIPD